MRRAIGLRGGLARAVFAAVALLLALAACGAPDPQLDRSAAGAKPSGRILFAQKGDIYVWDGSVTRLTKLGNASSPRWSSDGRRFIFVRTGDAFSDLYVANADGSGVRQITHDQPTLQPGSEAYVRNAVWALDPAWSRSGDEVAFVSDRGTDKNFLWLYRSLDENPTLVRASTLNGDNVEHPDFSPDGSAIVFDQRRPTSSGMQRLTQIFKVDLASGQMQALVEGDQGAYDPAWSPDGKWIAYIQRTGARNDLWVVPASGGQPVQLTSIGSVAAPAWSPDGTMIAFLESDGATFKASYVTFSVGVDGKPKAGKPQSLFDAEDIDATSGLSWIR